MQTSVKKMTAEYPLSSDPRPGRTWQLAGPPLRPQQARSARASPLEERNQQLKKEKINDVAGRLDPGGHATELAQSAAAHLLHGYRTLEDGDVLAFHAHESPFLNPLFLTTCRQ